MKAKATLILLTLLSPLQAYDNPVSYESGINDCDVIKYLGEYYITGNWLGGDMFRSRNLTDWGERTHCFSYNNSWHVQQNPNPDMDIHGTHIAYDNGLFHLYAHLATGPGNLLGIVHAVADHPMGPYTEPLDAPIATGTIDVKTFRDEDGSLHWYSTRFGGVSGNHNDYRRMTDHFTFTGSWKTLIWPTGGWEINPELPQYVGATINEGPFVWKYRDKYYMLYNANHTGDTSYAIGCALADSPNGFSNSGKIPYPLLDKTPYNNGSGTYNIYTLGQPWLVEGLNGFEKWAGYFAIDENERSHGRTQRIDRMHFLDRIPHVDGPTNRYTPGYHPGPAEPQLRCLFYRPDGPMPPDDWTETSPNNNPGQWLIANNEARQTDQDCFSFKLANRDPASHYLFEANVKFNQPPDDEDKAGVVAFYQDSNNWIIIGLDRSSRYNADNWYCHIRTDTTNQVVAAGRFDGKLDYAAWHKIRVERNASTFRVWIDDVLPPGFAAIQTDVTAPGRPGLYSDHGAAAFDGIIYTIGWDEFDNRIAAWGTGLNDNAQTGNWSVSTTGLTASGPDARAYKGDLMPAYEFSTHLYRQSGDGRMGAVAVAIDQENYLNACFDLASNTFVTTGRQNAQDIAPVSVPVADKTDYNLRVVKLTDRVIFFVDGQEVLTRPRDFPPSQVGLFAENMTARFNGILLYRTEPHALPGQWQSSDVGTVGFPGHARQNDATFTLDGSGSDIWLTHDGFQFLHQDLYGDGEIIARLVSSDITNYWNKAGIMIRDSLNDNAPMAALVLCGGGNLQFLYRSQTGQNAQCIEAPDPPFPQAVWLRLKRTGTSYQASYSYNGLGWATIGARNLAFANPYLKAGLVTSAHDNNRINGAVFDHLNISGCTPGDLPADLNRDCHVNIEDLRLLANQWPQAFTLHHFALLTQSWLTSHN